MGEKITSLKNTGRLAGLLYLILAITGAYGIMYVPSKIIVRGDGVTTASNMVANELLFRTGIVSQLISVTIFLIMALVLYRLFKQVNEHQAKLMVAFVIVQVPIVFLIETFNLTAIMILKGEVLKTYTSGQLSNGAMVFLKTHGYGIMILETFWGLWLIPFGQLVYKSGFIPRILGVLLVIAGIGYTIDSFTFILFPNYRSFTKLPAFTFSAIGEISTILWLLIKGVKSNEVEPIEV